MTRELSIAELATLAADTDDQTETSVAGEYEREVAPAGPNFARFVEYIELGKHPQKPYQGKEKPPAEMIRLTFELLNKKSIIEYEVDGVTKKRGHLISIKVKKSLSDKASFKKIFNAMTYGRDGVKHFAQMLGEAFSVAVHHNTGKDAAGKEVVYANLNNKDGVYSIAAPVHYDPIKEETTDLRPHIPEPFAPIRIFLWNNPTKPTWDSLFIDGTRTVKDGDKETEVSKNWLQENIMSALNYQGSPLDTMLHGVAELPLSEATAGPAVATQPTPSTEAKATSVAAATTSPSETGVIEMDAKPAEKAKEVAPAKAATPAADTSANDALAALGLT